jgi:hypothetical protein
MAVLLERTFYRFFVFYNTRRDAIGCATKNGLGKAILADSAARRSGSVSRSRTKAGDARGR